MLKTEPTTLLLKFLLACGLCLALAGCFQTSLTGTTGGTIVTVSLLREPGNVIGEQIVTRTESDWITVLGEATWSGYPRLVQLIFLGSSPAFDTAGIDPDGLYLLTASGGEDYFSNATAFDPGEPEPVQGSWHAIVPGQRLIEGNVQISVLTEATYRQAVGRLAQLNDAQVLEQLDAAARLLVTDIDNDDSVDYNDVLGWNPRVHGPRYLGDIFAQEALADGIRANQPAGSLDTLAKAVLGSRRVVMETNFGTLTMDTLNWEAPVTVDNFLQYVESGFYEDIIFHRVIRDFVIQAGLLTYDLDSETFDDPTPGAPIRNESRWSISNARGTVAMARTSDPDSATAQFYINQVDNDGLDFPAFGGGYAVFAVLDSGLDVVDTIANVPTTFFSGLADFPRQLIQIESASIED
ncbi:MAG: peptidylprolyl isomerase [Halieaceae bacterium]|nr:peptidylprolyl isomerase [Halieaceae bacterium]